MYARRDSEAPAEGGGVGVEGTDREQSTPPPAFENKPGTWHNIVRFLAGIERFFLYQAEK